MNGDPQRVATERRGHVLLIGLDRPAKRNAVDALMMTALNRAYTDLENDPQLRCGVLYANGRDFTGGVDLAEFADRWTAGENPILPADGVIDAMGLYGGARQKPIVSAVHGRCFTIGIELMLNTDVRIAADDTQFAQMEVQRGIYPVGGATLRFVHETGWGNAMKHLLTGDEFDAAEALRIGLVQEVVPAGSERERAMAIAERIATMAPLAVAATRESARLAAEESFAASVARLLPDLQELYRSQDAHEGLASFRERRSATFSGR